MKPEKKDRKPLPPADNRGLWQAVLYNLRKKRKARANS